MDRIRIVGGNKLNGIIPISGAKNAALPLMIAGLLTEDTLVLDNVPRLADVAQLQRILGNHGVDIMSAGKRPGDHEYQGQTLHISAANIIDTTAPYELVSRMRASFWVIAPLLARMHEAKVSLPGGCAIGTRPVDLLIMALEKLGAEIAIDGGYVIARAPGGLHGASIEFPKVTVSGTHVAVMAASLAKGTTVITNAACEPEILDVASCLNKMGARISGAGTPRIVVEGVEKLHGARHTVLPDRIETGTYAMAVAMTGGDVQLAGARPELLQSALDVLTQAGAVRRADQSRRRDRDHRRDHAIARRARDGDGFARLGVAGHRGACRRGRDHGQSRLPSRPRLRAARGQIVGLRRHHRAHQRIGFRGAISDGPAQIDRARCRRSGCHLSACPGRPGADRRHHLAAGRKAAGGRHESAGLGTDAVGRNLAAPADRG